LNRRALRLLLLAMVFLAIPFAVPHLVARNADLAQAIGVRHPPRGEPLFELRPTAGGLEVLYAPGGYLYFCLLEIGKSGQLVPVIPAAGDARSPFGRHAPEEGERLVVHIPGIPGTAAPRKAILFALLSATPIRLAELARYAKELGDADPERLAAGLSRWPGRTFVRTVDVQPQGL
jgi:hypothetical protein